MSHAQLMFFFPLFYAPIEAGRLSSFHLAVDVITPSALSLNVEVEFPGSRASCSAAFILLRADFYSIELVFDHVYENGEGRDVCSF